MRRWAIKELGACLPKHPSDANFLYKSVASFIEASKLSQVRRGLVGHAKRQFATASASEFAASFSESSPYTLGNFIRYNREKSKRFRTRGEDWRWLAPLLLKGMEVNPTVMIPSVIMIFGNLGWSDGPPSFQFDEAEMEALFAAELPRVLDLITRPFDLLEGLDSRFVAAVPLAKSTATAWAARLRNTSGQNNERSEKESVDVLSKT